MRSRFNGGNSLSEEERLELFQRGKVKVPPARSSSYTRREGDNLVLRAKALRDPAVFIASLRDFVRSNSLWCWRENTNEVIFSESEWQDHIRHSADILRRSVTRYGTVLTKDAVRARLSGEAAEFTVGHWLQKMVQCYKADPEADVTIPVWTGREETVELGGDYYLQPFQGTNLLLFNDDRSLNVGEHDMMLAMKDSALFVDVSTSVSAVEGKLERELMPEELFMKFRRKMNEVFLQSKGSKGYRNSAKIHVVCSSGKSASASAVVQEKGENGVFTLQLPAYHSIHLIQQALFDGLQDLGILTIGKDDIFVLSSS